MLARWLYTLCYALATPVFWWRLDWRDRDQPGRAGRQWERWGFYRAQPQEIDCWLHTASVGEYMAARPLIQHLLTHMPEHRLLITTMTATGSDRVRQDLGDRVAHVYIPFDLPGAIHRFMRHFSPRQLVILETELWPNLVHAAHRAGVPVLVINARLSARSAHGYQRVLPVVRPMLRELTRVAVQAHTDGERFLDLGLPPSALVVTGSLKYELHISAELKAAAHELRQRWGSERPVLIAASTHKGEDEQVLNAFRLIREQHPGTLLVLVPRHPERFAPVAELVVQQGWCLSRHSSKDPVTAKTDVVLGDTMGELLCLLGASDVAFIGGSLEPIGGHNMLEAVAMGVPAISGPHVFNFQVVVDMLETRQALITVSSPVGLAQAVNHLLADADFRKAVVERGLAVVAANRGALERIVQLLQQHAPRNPQQ